MRKDCIVLYCIVYLKKHQNWKFTGSYSGFQPIALSSLLHWIMIGPQKIIDTERSNFSKQQNYTEVLLEINCSSGKDFKFKKNPIIEPEICFNPTPPNEYFQNFERPTTLINLNKNKNKDSAWAIMQVANDNSICSLPTWSALLMKSTFTTTCRSLLLYPGHPTNWGNLYTALKIVERINVSVGGNQKPIVTLDLNVISFFLCF